MIVAKERDVQRLRLEGDSMKNVHKKVHISPQEGCEGQVMHKMGEDNLLLNSKRKLCWRFSEKKSRLENLQPSMG